MLKISKHNSTDVATKIMPPTIANPDSDRANHTTEVKLRVQKLSRRRLAGTSASERLAPATVCVFSVACLFVSLCSSTLDKQQTSTNKEQQRNNKFVCLTLPPQAPSCRLAANSRQKTLAKLPAGHHSAQAALATQHPAANSSASDSRQATLGKRLSRSCHPAANSRQATLGKLSPCSIRSQCRVRCRLLLCHLFFVLNCNQLLYWAIVVKHIALR